MKLAALLVASIGLATAWTAVSGAGDGPLAAAHSQPGAKGKAATPGAPRARRVDVKADTLESTLLIHPSGRSKQAAVNEEGPLTDKDAEGAGGTKKTVRVGQVAPPVVALDGRRQL